MNQDVNGNRKLFWKEVGKVNGGKVEEYYEDFYNIDTQSTCMALMGFEEAVTSEESRVKGSMYEARVVNLKNGKAAGEEKSQEI